MEIKTTWNTVKWETRKIHLTEQKLSSFINGEKVKDLETVANVISNYL
jgi:hypothetical protein